MTKLVRDEQIHTLTRLGLSLVQAKTYLNLAKLGKADIKTIAVASNVARQDTYRIMFSLQEMGLAEKILAKTAMYRATPIKEGLSLLLEKQKREYSETQEQVKALFNNFYEKTDTAGGQDDIQFTITSELVLLLRSHEKLAELTRANMDMLIPLKLSEEQFYKKFRYIKGATRRGVKIRVILQEFRGEILFRNISENPLCEIRYLPENSVQCGMHIFDRRELTLAVSEKKPTPSLWTNSPNVVKLAEVYFENMWNNRLIITC